MWVHFFKLRLCENVLLYIHEKFMIEYYFFNNTGKLDIIELKISYKIYTKVFWAFSTTNTDKEVDSLA